MGDEVKDEKLIRSYLLGELSEGELEAVEERLMTDREFADLALVVESMLVDDYIEGNLGGRDRRYFKRRFLATPQGSEYIRFTNELKEYALGAKASESDVKPRNSMWPSVFGAPRWAMAAAVTLLITAGIVVAILVSSKSEVDKGLTALGKAYQEQPIDARITGLDYAPKASLRGDPAQRVDNARLKQAEITLTNEARANPGFRSFHALGRFYLTQKDFKQAIDYFGKALELKPNSAEIHSDLGAAFLEMGEALKDEDPSKGAEEFSQSREHLSRALDLDPDLLEARFNRALLYQQMGLFPDVKNEWQEYIRRDNSSPWADEARKNINAIQDQQR